MDSYIICTTQRTGSTLLCDLLTSTGVAGNPDSFFMSDVDPVWVEQWGLPARGNRGDAGYGAACLAAAIKVGKGPTDIFGLRLMRENLDDLSALIDDVLPGLPSDKARFEAAFGKILYVYLARGDKLAQAVSMVKAEQTGLWHVAPDGTELERLAPPREPEYDFARIAGKLEQLERHDAAWSRWFDTQGIEPLRIGYENLSADPAKEVSRICAALGVAAPAPASLKPGVARLADAVSLAWMHRYLEDLEARGS